jgi:hypothetical protein
VLGTAERMAMLRNNPMSAAISLRPQVSRKFPSRPHADLPIHPLSFRIQPSSAPHSPTPVPVLTVSGAAGAKVNSCYEVGQARD